MFNIRKSSTETDFTDITKEQLVSDFKTVVADAEALLRATANQGGEAMTTVRDKAASSLANAKARLTGAQDALVEKTRYAAHATDDYVHDNPWRAVSVAAMAGFLIGLLMSRR